MKKVVSAMVLTLFLVGMLTLAFNIQPVKSDWTWTEPIYIRADGSVDPPTAPIWTIDNVTYTLTDNIFGDVPEQSSAIVIERDSIVFNGAGYTVQQGTASAYSKGISLSGKSNVTIKNTHVTKFYYGTYLHSSTDCKIENVTATDNNYGIALFWKSNQNILFHNNATNNSRGIYIGNSNNNNVTSNTITDGEIRLWDASNNILFGNVVSSNGVDGIVLNGAHNNTLSAT